MENAILNNKGFTILEVLVAMVIFSFVLIFMAQGFLIAYQFNYQKLLKDETIKIAQEELELRRNTSFNNIVNTCLGVCDNFDPDTASPTCIIQRQVRNTTVKFGREITVINNDPYKKVTIKICTDRKGRDGNPIAYTLTTIISNKGF